MRVGAVRLFVGMWILLSPLSHRAVVFFNTADPQNNTTAPIGELAGSGWDLQGESFAGVPIAPNFILTATHIGGQSGGTFRFAGIDYVMTASYQHPDCDLTIWKVEGSFPRYAEIYTRNDEVGRPVVVFGRGCQRGQEVLQNGVLKGWLWGPIDGALRWGENQVAGISDEKGKPAETNTRFQLLRMDFDADAGPNEAHLSGGDSGGGLFIRDGGAWKLAGIDRAANQEYNTTADGAGFDATLFDEAGYFEGEEGKREYHDLGALQPGSFYATRISAYAGWIQCVIAEGDSPNSSLILEESLSLFGPFTPVAGAMVDESSRTISAPRPDGTRFYRILSDSPQVIRQITWQVDEVKLIY